MNKIKLSLDVSFYDFEKVHRSVSESIDLEAENTSIDRDWET